MPLLNGMESFDYGISNSIPKLFIEFETKALLLTNQSRASTISISRDSKRVNVTCIHNNL